MYLRKLSLCLLAFSLVCIRAGAQQTQPAQSPTRRAIKAGRLLNVRTGEVSNNVFVLIEGERIVSVSRSAPANTQIIDLSNQTVLPGLIDCHAHLLGNLKDFSPASGLHM